MTPSLPAVEWSARIYGWLLRAYPGSFRRQYGAEMRLVFREQASDVWARAGWTGLAGVWLRVLADLAQTLPEQYLLSCRAILRMDSAAPWGTKTLLTLSLFAAFALHLVIFCLLGITIGLIEWGWSGNPAYGLGPVSMLLVELLLILAPPLLTGIIASRARMFYRPYLIAPLAPMTLWAATGLFDTGGPWPLKIGVPLMAGAVTLLGCYGSDNFFRRETASCPVET